MAKVTCEHPEGCDRPVIARGLCAKHYQREKTAGNLPPLPPKTRSTCPIVTDGEPCGRPVSGQGLCNGHYKRWQEKGDVLADVPLQKKRRGYTEECSRPECKKPAIAGGLCKRHYAEERDERLAQEECKNPRCGRPQGPSGGYCSSCYQRFLQYGDPNAGPPRRKRRAPSKKVGRRSEYHVNHQMVRKVRGPAWQQACLHCDKAALQWAQIHGTAGDRATDYMPLCGRCHAKYDHVERRLPDNTGSKRTTETRELLSQRAKERWADPAQRKRASQTAILREARKREAREAD